MNKRGSQNLLFKQIIVLVVFLALLVGLIIFLTTKGSGELARKEIFAKQLCVIITGAKPGTVINTTSEMIIEKSPAGISVKKSGVDIPYVYPCENHNFEIEREESNTIIKIKTKEEMTSNSEVEFPGST